MLLRAWTVIMCTATAVLFLLCGVNWIVGDPDLAQLHPFVAFPLMIVMLVIPHLMLLKEAHDAGVDLKDYLEFLENQHDNQSILRSETEESPSQSGSETHSARSMFR